MKHIGFTGTRETLTPEQQNGLWTVLEALRKREFEVLHHGDCVGADAITHAHAGKLGFRRVIHPPINWTYRASCQGEEEREPKDYIPRNHDIVDESEILVACPKGPEEVRSGTWATIRRARQRGRPIIIIWPDGKVTTEKP